MARESLYLLRFLPREQSYIITGGSGSMMPEITTSHQAWETWLNTIGSFAFEGRSGGHCTIRRERLQRGDAYWYAYRSIQGRTKKRYLGKTADLTLERLEEVSALFTTLESQQHIQPDSAWKALHLMTLLEIKLHPPQLAASLIKRTRLLKRLDSGLAHKLTVLQAPAGSGKTTLVNQWLAARSSVGDMNAQEGLAWVSLDAGDNDPLRFWRYVMTACQKLLGESGREVGQAALSLLTTTIFAPFAAPPIDMALAHLLNALADPSSGGLLVLDDYHVISESSIHEMLTFFIDHLPTTVHVLLLSRAEPELPLLRWRARGELSLLHGVDLRFSSEETATFLHQTLPISPSEAALKQLEQSLEGW